MHSELVGPRSAELRTRRPEARAQAAFQHDGLQKVALWLLGAIGAAALLVVLAGTLTFAYWLCSIALR